MRIGIIADVHGNSWALDAVLEDAAGRGIDRWLNAGDCVFGPLDPASTARRLRDLGAVTVRGNQDRALTEPKPDAHDDPTFRFVYAALDPDDLAWLASLPRTARDGDIFLCHGTPRDDEEPLVERVHVHGVGWRDGAAIAALLGDLDGASLVVCGHTHVLRTIQLPDGPLVLNPGSVGLPAYTAGAPFPHAMEAGSPHARYAVVEHTAAGWLVDAVAVPYDWATAARVAGEHGRPDWARWLATGRA